MPLSKNINTYSDIATVLQAVVASGKEQATWRLPTVGQAVRFVQRAYQYRLLLQKALAASAAKGVQPPTPYDKMRMTRVENEILIDLAPPIVGEFIENGIPIGGPQKVVSAPQSVGLKLDPKDQSFLESLAQLARDVGDEG